MPGRPPKYSPEFKEQAIKEVIDGKKSVAQVANELGISSKTLGPWVTKYRKKVAGQPIPDDMPDNERMKELERRNRELEQENAFLKKAAAYFAKEHR
jgi:transposase-like protein